MTTVNVSRDEALRDFSRRWRFDFDLLRCRKCDRGILLSKRDEDMRHAHECEQADQVKPWDELQQALASAEQPPEQGDVTDNAAHEIIIGEILKRNPVDVTADAIWRQIKPVNPPQEPVAVVHQLHYQESTPNGHPMNVSDTKVHWLTDKHLLIPHGTKLYLAPPANDLAVSLLARQVREMMRATK